MKLVDLWRWLWIHVLVKQLLCGDNNNKFTKNVMEHFKKESEWERERERERARNKMWEKKRETLEIKWKGDWQEKSDKEKERERVCVRDNNKKNK